MGKVALAKITDWVAAAGIEKVPAAAPVAARLQKTTEWTDEFDDSSFDTSLFGGPVTASGGTVTEAGGVLEIDTSGANNEVGFFWIGAALDTSKTFEIAMRFRYTNAIPDSGPVFHVQHEADPSTPSIGTRAIALYYNTNVFYASKWNAGGTRNWFNETVGSGWTGVQRNAMFSWVQNTWYIVKFKSDGTNWWYEIWDGADTQPLFAVTPIAWAATYAPGGSYYFTPGNYITSNGRAVLEFDYITYMVDEYSATSPVIESPWAAVTHEQIDDVDIAENAVAALLGYSAGTVKYQYALNAGAYNGSWLTLAALKSALAGASVTSHTSALRLKAQLNSDGSTRPDISVASELEVSGLDTSAVFNQPLDTLDISTKREVIET